MEKQKCGPEDFRGEVLYQMDGDYIRAKLVLPGEGKGLRITKTISKELIDKARVINILLKPGEMDMIRNWDGQE